MAKKKSSAAYVADKIMYAFIGECAGSEISGHTIDDLQKEYLDYQESLDEISCMIEYFQDIHDSSEVAYWRKMLMHNKMVMREIKEKIKVMKVMDAITQKEIIYS